MKRAQKNRAKSKKRKKECTLQNILLECEWREAYSSHHSEEEKKYARGISKFYQLWIGYVSSDCAMVQVFAGGYIHF